MLEALTRQRGSDQWTRDNGRYIPNPSTWLNQERWSDELKGPMVHVQPANPAANFSQRVWTDDDDEMERFMRMPNPLHRPDPRQTETDEKTRSMERSVVGV